MIVYAFLSETLPVNQPKMFSTFTQQANITNSPCPAAPSRSVPSILWQDKIVFGKAAGREHRRWLEQKHSQVRAVWSASCLPRLSSPRSTYRASSKMSTQIMSTETYSTLRF